MAVTPMNSHFIWWDGNNLQETHVNDVINNIGLIPPGVKNGFLILVLRYINPSTGTEDWNGIKLGHFIAGRDHYYVDFQPSANPERVVYGMWDGNTTGGTRITVYELQGENTETFQIDVRANTLPNSRVFDGVLISDNDWNTAMTMAEDF